MGKNSGKCTLLKVFFDVPRVSWGVSQAGAGGEGGGWRQVNRLVKKFSIYWG